AALWWRLAVLHEEMREYFRLESFNSRLRVQMTGDRFFRRAAAAEADPFNEWVRAAHRLNHPPNVLAASLLRRARHWRLVIGVGRSHAINALVLGAAIVALYL